MQDFWIPHAVSDTDLKHATNAAYQMSRQEGSRVVADVRHSCSPPLLSPSSTLQCLSPSFLTFIVPRAALSAE